MPESVQFVDLDFCEIKLVDCRQEGTFGVIYSKSDPPPLIVIVLIPIVFAPNVF